MSTTTADNTRPALSSFLGLVFWLGLCFLAAGLGGMATGPEIQGWYATLEKPPINPPNWVFGPVWTTLFIMMGVAAWRVWRIAGFGGARLALGLFLAQLVLNVLWSVLFFALHSPGAAFVEVFGFWATMLAATLAFARHDRLAAWLMVPTLAWVAFAAVLNGWIWWIN
ncbi:tryptophan-rich sensory protein [Aerophototrophica crusticola]|uniref:Tryptophan-rich sensory protein n=1 Tax=Aerophototrophica crusticola TaxID=1709002 RepID=A0A858RB53_9PROT|nr:tryptophan-rich sensory protein [Rhodospirillaceae bacterium B3]